MGQKERHLHRIPVRRLGIHHRVLQHRAQVLPGLAPRLVQDPSLLRGLLNQDPKQHQHQNLIPFLIRLGVMGET